MGGAGAGSTGSTARPGLPATAFGNGADTHMAALGCEDLTLSVLSRRCPACSRCSCRCRRGRRLPLPPLRRPAPPLWAPPPALPSGSRTPQGRPQLAPPSGVTRQSGLPTVSSSLWLRETEGRPKVSVGIRQLPGNCNADLKTGVGGAREPLLLASYPDLCSPEDLRPPSCHRKQVLGADTEKLGWLEEVLRVWKGLDNEARA